MPRPLRAARAALALAAYLRPLVVGLTAHLGHGAEVDESYADPLNTATPTSNGAVGLVPDYMLVDLNAGVDVTTG